MNTSVAPPYQVSNPDGKTHLIIMNAEDGLPAAFALMGTRAAKKAAIRVTGGCKGMSAEDKAYMLEYFAAALAGFSGVIWSGATRQTDAEGKLDPMVTDVPGIIAAENPFCVALGTVPRTEMLSLQGDSRLVLDQWGTLPNPSQSAILIVQNGAEGALDWDGDLDVYFRIMDNWQQFAGFSALGVIAWNGGEITREEIMRSAKKGWPTILVRGSGRVTDEIIVKLEAGDEELMKLLPKEHRLVIVDKNDPVGLSERLADLGFLG